MSAAKQGFMLNPAVLDFVQAPEATTNFWRHLLKNEELQNSNDLEKLVAGCEIIAALDAICSRPNRLERRK
jgi:hypothetical protein